MGGVRGSGRTSEPLCSEESTESTQTSSWKTKQREFGTEISAGQHFPAKKLFACPPQQLRAGCWGSGFRSQTPRERTEVDCHEDALRWLVWHSWMSPVKSLGLAKMQDLITVAGPFNSTDPLIPQAPRLQDPAFMSAIGGTSQLQSETSEVGHAYRPATAMAGMSARGEGQDRAGVCDPKGRHDGCCISCQAKNRHRSLPTTSWEPMQLGSS